MCSGESENRCGYRLRTGCAAIACLWTILLAGGCKPQFGQFLPAGASFSRTFGQLYDDAGTPKLSHYVIVKVPPGELQTVTNGTIEYQPDFAGMGHCVLVKPATYPISTNDFSGLQLMPSPAALVLAYCHLDEASVRAAARDVYMRALPTESSSDWDAAAAHFIARDEGFVQLDVRNEALPMPISDGLGKAINNDLYFAVFREADNEPALFVNPLPLMAVTVPGVTLDAVAPTIADIVVQTSISGTFVGDVVNHPIVGGTIAAPLPRHPMRIAIRSNERTAAAGAVTIPYKIKTQINFVTGGGETRSRGLALFNSFHLPDSAELAARAFGSEAPAESSPSTEQYFPFVAWNTALPVPAAGDEVFNALTVPGSFLLDLNRITNGVAAFPGGQYQLTLTVADIAQASLQQVVSFQLEPGVEMHALQDSTPADTNFTCDTPVDFVHIARWDDTLGGTLANGPDPANFVARDPSRFCIRIRDNAANANPGSADTILANIGVVSDESGSTVDDLTPLQLVETGANTGIFVSRSQILTPSFINPASTTCNSGDKDCEDDLFWVHDGVNGLVADDTLGDRTHRAHISDHVHVTYRPAGTTADQALNVPVCRRDVDERRSIWLRITVFDHLVDHNRVQAEVDRGNLGWAPACLEFRVREERFVDGPVDSGTGQGIFDDGGFSQVDLANPGAASDEKRVIADFRSQAHADVAEVFFIPTMDGPDAALARTDSPKENIAGLGELTFIFIADSTPVDKRALAHELGHALENGDRDHTGPTPPIAVFYPQRVFQLPDNTVEKTRRISAETVDMCRLVRTGGPSNPGSRLQHPY